MPKKQTPKPYIANQFVVDPRQDQCWEYFINPKSETFGNAYASAVKANYAKTTAGQITTEEWWLEKVRRVKLLGKAEKVLEHTLEMETNLDVIGMFGPIKDPVTRKVMKKEDAALLGIKQNSAKFVAERLGKKVGYSTRQEVTGADGKDLPRPIYAGRSREN